MNNEEKTWIDRLDDALSDRKKRKKWLKPATNVASVITGLAVFFLIFLTSMAVAIGDDSALWRIRTITEMVAWGAGLIYVCLLDSTNDYLIEEVLEELSEGENINGKKE